MRLSCIVLTIRDERSLRVIHYHGQDVCLVFSKYHILSVGERGAVAEIEKTKAKEVKKTTDAKASDETSGFNIAEFFKGSREELAKVVWPSRQQL
ncbi:MAG: preprotein translocase subunit SecE, partial [Cyanobacteria bacterium J06638_22]